MSFFLRILIVTLLLSPTFIYAREQSMVLPREYADSKVGDVSSIQQMLARGISVNAVDEKGNSLLMLAAYKGDLKKVKFLIDSGADINQRNEKNFLTFGDTPMDYAIRGYQKEIVDLFLSLNFDVNAKFRKATSTIYKCGMTGNYEMLRYLLRKGVAVSDEDKINTMIVSLPYGNAPIGESSRKVIRLLLEDLHVEADDLWKSPLTKRGNSRDVKRVETILAIQNSYEKAKEKRLAEQRKQDSLKLLLKTGQADTIRYCYMERIAIGEDGARKSEIIVEPRVDFVRNRQGDKDSAASLILWGLTVFMVYCCCPKIVRHLYNGRPTYLFPYLATYSIGLWVFYSIFSCIFSNLDDITVRKYGEEKIAVLEGESHTRQYRRRAQYHTVRYVDYYFVFTGSDSIRISVAQGNTRFDASDYPSEEDRSHIKVRYESDSRKLSVDNGKYFVQNWIWISFMCLLLLLILMLSWGRFNGVLDMIRRKWQGVVESKGSKTVAFEPEEYEAVVSEKYQYFEDELSLDTFWTFTSREYQSKYDFIRDVKDSEERNGADPDERLHPDEIFLEFPIVRIGISNESTIGEDEFYIEITSDNGANITEGELLFKLHNQMIPYLDQLPERVMGAILPIRVKEDSGVVECMLMFQSELEPDELELENK